LYQPSKYAEHNTSLDRWMLKFNARATHTLGIWNSDFQERVTVRFATDFKLKQDGSMRLSDKYKIYRNEELWILKTWLLNTYPLQLGRVKLGK
jgi:hypothetical protein